MKHVTTFLIFFIGLLAFGQEPTDTLALMNVNVVDAKMKPNPGETIVFVNALTEERKVSVSDSLGEFKILVPEGSDQIISIETAGMENFYRQINIPSDQGTVTFNMTIKYNPPRVITLKNVNFQTGSAALTVASFDAVDKLILLLEKKPTLEVEIRGHTDNVGNDQTNLDLSQKRAETVARYLISKGIAQSRLVAKGYGSTIPIAPNDTANNRALNRRTEVKVIKE